MSAVEVFMQRRFRCPHCRRSWTKKATAVAHVVTCWRDPANRACLTCVFHDEGSHATYEEPGEEESCQVDAASFDVDGRYLVRTGCPMWEPTRWVATVVGVQS